MDLSQHGGSRLPNSRISGPLEQQYSSPARPYDEPVSIDVATQRQWAVVEGGTKVKDFAA